MQPHQTLTEVSSSPLSLHESADISFIRNFTGNYYRVLGWIGVVSSIISIAIIGFAIPGAKANFGYLEFRRPHPAFFLTGVLVVAVFAVPGVILLGKRGRAAFTKNEEGEPDIEHPAKTMPLVPLPLFSGWQQQF